MTDLLPCPFCGGEPAPHDYEDGYWQIVCTCTAFGALRGTEAEAITAWNTRALTRLELRQAIEQRLSKALGGTISRQFRNRLASDIAALSATNSEAVSELEQIQLLATNHGGWLENDPAKLVADIHKLATAALAKMGRGA
jgi:Lar family restriction alleviation protein